MVWNLHHRPFLPLLSVFCPKPSVTEVGGLLPGLLQSSVMLLVPEIKEDLTGWGEAMPQKVPGVHTPLWGEASSAMQTCPVCLRGGDSRVSSGITAGWKEDLLSSHPFQFWLFLQGENNLQNGSLQVLHTLSRRCDDEVKVVKQAVKEGASFCWGSGFGQDGRVLQNE